ncbi:hypothetical protein JA33_149 [Dickeya phage vB_DsoM_JA33]|uniref:J domain-containing protein n=2 Tax=Salmondvirus JA11 TaxID=2734141 RepID=A0A386K5Y3_9CAUD|nr:hypothetical protein HOU32_gp149 [Dickeya phage vB_DsoM_JA11]AXG67523.1 hypothetical protein JA33_149 [Dickeya phage vB_DsoM_JA33]AYD79954.1 hypothetical protein JA11_149 [Dickeya phage vB_DsoM_JA11]
MQKSFSLVPVSLPAPIVEIEEDNSETTAEREANAQSEYVELEHEIERLEFEKEMTESRATSTRKYMENRFQDLVDEVEELLIQVEEKYEKENEVVGEDDVDLENEDEDDPDAKADLEFNSSRDDDDRPDIDEDDDGFNSHDNELRQQAEEKMSVSKKCRKIYFAIASRTHPDRCGNTSKVHLFRQAVQAVESLNLEWLEKIYVKVFGKPYGKQNLFERVMALRLRKRELQEEILEIKQTTSWVLHLLEIEEGRESAARQFEAALRRKRSHLLALLKGDFSQCES